MSLQHFAPEAETAEIVATLRRDGAAVIENAAPPESIEAVRGELRSYFDSEGTREQGDFNGYTTLRIMGILARSRASADLIAHPKLLEIADAILLPHCLAYRIGSTTGIEIHPGETAQVLHRDDCIYPLRVPGMELQFSTNWALDDFTEENGATRLLPGSHAWKEGTMIDESACIQATMPKGSVLLYLGSMLHGGGANRSNAPRMGLVNTYALGWLRQEENQYLTIPREIAESYPERVRRLMGYQTHGRLLGWYPDNPDGI